MEAGLAVTRSMAGRDAPRPGSAVGYPYWLQATFCSYFLQHVVPPELLVLVRRLRARTRLQEEAAARLGISSDRLGRLLTGEGYALGFPALLKLALESDEDPAAVFRAAGKAEIADLLDELYRKRGRTSVGEQALVNLFLRFLERLSVEEREAVRLLLRTDEPVPHVRADDGQMMARRRGRRRVMERSRSASGSDDD